MLKLGMAGFILILGFPGVLLAEEPQGSPSRDIAAKSSDQALKKSAGRPHRKTANLGNLIGKAPEEIFYEAPQGFPMLSEADFKELKEKSEGNSKAQDVKTSPQFENLRKDFLALKSGKDLAHFFGKLEEIWKTSTDRDARFFAACLLLLKPFQGFVVRMDSLLEHDGNRISQSVGRTYLRKVTSYLDVFFPVSPWQPALDYVSTPGTPDLKLFNREWDLQNFLVAEFYPALKDAAYRLTTLLREEGGGMFRYDKDLFYAGASFAEDLDHVRLVGIAEISEMLQVIHLTAHNLLVFSSYNMNDLLEVAKKVGNLHGMDGFLSKEIDGVNSFERFKAMRSRDDFLKLRGPKLEDTDKVDTSYGKRLMALALEHMRQAIQFNQLAMDRTWAGQDNDFRAMNPAKLRPFKRRLGVHIKSWRAVFLPTAQEMSSGVVISSVVKNKSESVKVNFVNFYLDPVKDLKDLFPKDFNTDTQKKLKLGKIDYYDYSWGRPTGWELKHFVKYIPSAATAKDPAYIGKAARIIRQSWAGRSLAFPLSVIVQ